MSNEPGRLLSVLIEAASSVLEDEGDDFPRAGQLASEGTRLVRELSIEYGVPPQALQAKAAGLAHVRRSTRLANRQGARQ